MELDTSSFFIFQFTHFLCREGKGWRGRRYHFWGVEMSPQPYLGTLSYFSPPPLPHHHPIVWSHISISGGPRMNNGVTGSYVIQWEEPVLRKSHHICFWFVFKTFCQHHKTFSISVKSPSYQFSFLFGKDISQLSSSLFVSSRSRRDCFAWHDPSNWSRNTSI
jgi:hypothetical protein